jgi:hypothetical protein
MEVLTTTAAIAIGKIALDKFVEGGAGELGKKLTTAATDKLMKLGGAVWDKIRGNERAKEVLVGAAADRPEDVMALTNYLGSLWSKPEFAQEVKKLADDLHFELTQIQDNSSIVTNVYDGGTAFVTPITGDYSTTFIGGNHHHKDKPVKP